MKVLIDGSVPPGAGLSSSSAFVVASTLATACANQITVLLQHHHPRVSGFAIDTLTSI